MPYYTLHMHMDAHHYVYHRNICSLHSVHEVVHSEYPGKKQRLNIRVYFDEEKHYFYSNVRGLLEKYPTFGREKETGLLGALDT